MGLGLLFLLSVHRVNITSRLCSAWDYADVGIPIIHGNLLEIEPRPSR